MEISPLLNFKIVLIIILGSNLISKETHAQFKNFNSEEQNWYKGEIHLNSGEIIKSEINYNFVMDVVRHKSDEGIEAHSSRKVSSFTYYDPFSKTTRKFYALPFQADEAGRKVPFFFEALFEGQNLAILSRLTLNENRKPQVSELANYYIIQTTGQGVKFREFRWESVLENIFLADNKGNILPYVDGTVSISNSLTFVGSYRYNEKKRKKSNTSKKVREETVYSFLYESALADLTGVYFNDLISYANEHELSIKKVSGLTELFEYYDKLTLLHEQ